VTIAKNRVVGIIPARLQASRLPGKPLARIAGVPMIEHVYRRSRLNPRFDEIYVATCDRQIAEAAAAFGCPAIMTSDAHQRGTDRVAEAARGLAAGVIVNIQGDEPFIRPEIFDALLAPFDVDPSVECTNLMAPIRFDGERDSLNAVKVVVDRRGDAMYFSRESIPTRRMGQSTAPAFRQIGIYAFTAPLLRRFTELAPTPHEAEESCDMLRLLEHGHRIRMVSTDVALHSVDTPADLARAEVLMTTDELFKMGIARQS